MPSKESLAASGPAQPVASHLYEVPVVREVPLTHTGARTGQGR